MLSSIVLNSSFASGSRAADVDIFAQTCKYKLMNKNEAQELAGLLKALGEFNRLSLVYKLCQCKAPQNAMCLCECCSVDASGVSRHLKVLAQEGIVSSERKGREIQYSLNRGEVSKRLRKLADIIEAEPSPEM